MIPTDIDSSRHSAECLLLFNQKADYCCIDATKLLIFFKRFGQNGNIVCTNPRICDLKSGFFLCLNIIKDTYLTSR